MVFHFGRFELDDELYELRRAGKTVAVEPKVFDLLAHLIRQRQRVVTRDELLAAVWKGAHVSDSALSSCIRDARRVLGDDGVRQHSIQTVHGRGFRFVAAAKAAAEAQVAPAPPAARAEPRRIVFVGRELAMGRLRAALAQASAGRGTCAFLIGEAGIGKTRTAEELATFARAHGAEVLSGRCSETAGAPAFWPWMQVLREYAARREAPQVLERMGAAATDLAPLVPALAQTAEDREPLDPSQARFRLYSSLSQFLRAAAAARPMVIFLDDLHQADTSTLLALEFVARELKEMPIVLLGAYRDTDVGREHPLTRVAGELARLDWCERIELGGLSAAEVRLFLAQTAGGSPAESLIAAVHEKSAGNPFFLTEVVRLLASDESLAAAAKPGWRLPVPRSTRDAIGRRLAGLPRACEALLSAAAVLGRDFDAVALERLMAPRSKGGGAKQRAARHQALDAAEEARIIEPLAEAPGRYRFTHVLIRDTLYEAIPAARRRRWHRAAGEVLERLHRLDGEPAFAILAHHFAEAADEATMGKAVLYSMRAGERDATTLAYEGAVEHYQRALRLLERGARPSGVARRTSSLRLAGRAPTSRPKDDLCEVLLALGENQWKSGDRPAARQTFVRAAAAARARRSWTQLGRAALAYGGAFRGFEVAVAEPELIELLEEALRHLNGGPAPLRALVLGRLAVALYNTAGTLERRRALTQQAIRVAETSGDGAAHLAALYSRHWGTWGPDNAEERVKLATAMVRLSAAEKDTEMGLQAHRFLLIDQLEMGALAAVDAELAAVSRLADELRQPYYSWYVTCFRAMRALLRSDFGEAQQLVQAALAHGQRAQSPNVLHQYGAQQFFLQRELGQLSLVEADVRGFVQQYPSVAAWRCAYAFVQTEMDRRDEAQSILEDLAANDFGGVARDTFWSVSMTLAADVCVYTADERRAAILYRLIAPFAQRTAIGGVGAVCITSFSRNLGGLAALLGRRQAAARHYEDALTMHERLQSRHLVAHTQREYGEALMKQGDDERAIHLLERALATYESLGMASFAQRTAKTLARPTRSRFSLAGSRP